MVGVEEAAAAIAAAAVTAVEPTVAAVKVREMEVESARVVETAVYRTEYTEYNTYSDQNDKCIDPSRSRGSIMGTASRYTCLAHCNLRYIR